ncbi:hypothetical protein BBC27_08720 [Acidithiobacillus ferrivorans]|uniref:ChrR-like cupin domain-containing protein n=1 Tax=Acidithiobacillus ferrivorans TaxID=160808 RepID=A0A1B9BZW7_9PROT|nr:hypothetical protein [Acidithiobacillus ferrivorans]OCB03267.1 hypothetical protein BBC27_08720 [Acidithiobacillus ferrivorans]
MSLHPIMASSEQIPWTAGSQALGDISLFQDTETVHFKMLSDRRSEGGGMAQIVRFSPPAGMLIKIVANARSDEHIYILSGGHGDKSGRQRLYPGDYLLHPKGLAHGAFLAIETTVFQVYSGEPDELVDFKIVAIDG